MLISQSFLLEDFGHHLDELVWRVLVEVRLPLHVATEVLPLVQGDILTVGEVGHEGLDPHRERAHVDLADDRVLLETSTERRDVLMAE